MKIVKSPLCDPLLLILRSDLDPWFMRAHLNLQDILCFRFAPSVRAVEAREVA